MRPALFNSNAERGEFGKDRMPTRTDSKETPQRNRHFFIYRFVVRAGAAVGLGAMDLDQNARLGLRPAPMLAITAARSKCHGREISDGF